MAAVFIFMQVGSAAPGSGGAALPGSSTASGSGDLAAGVRGAASALDDRLLRQVAIAARHKHPAAPLAQQHGLQASAAPTPSASASPAPAPAPAPPASDGGTDAAHSALGDCIRNAEEGGSYAWGPGNGGGAYQFEEGTWVHYGGAASEYGVAGPAYQDQIFDNAVAAGGASNWTDYDGC